VLTANAAQCLPRKGQLVRRCAEVEHRACRGPSDPWRLACHSCYGVITHACAMGPRMVGWFDPACLHMPAPGLNILWRVNQALLGMLCICQGQPQLLELNSTHVQAARHSLVGMARLLQHRHTTLCRRGFKSPQFCTYIYIQTGRKQVACHWGRGAALNLLMLLSLWPPPTVPQ
jgi:hypothetical protein